jgi:transcriptional regulator with XRE-family HTH domain
VPDSEQIRRSRRLAFGAALRAVREKKGLTQETVALDAGLDRSFYVEVELGKHSIALDRVFDIAEALETPMAKLFKDVTP